MKSSLWFLLLWPLLSYGYQKDPLGPIPLKAIDQTRATALASLLPEKPKGLGENYHSRKYWDAFRRSGKFNKVLRMADTIMKSPLPAFTEALYMSFFNSNDSETSKNLLMKRRTLFFTLVVAECVENKNRYMPAIKAGIDDLLKQKSWNFPAEDRQKTNYNGTQYTINLSSADYAHTLAESLYLLDDKLDPQTRKQVMDALYLRIFIPTVQAIEDHNKKQEFVSLTNTGNHNAVTLSGVTGAALTVIESREERAWYVALAERYSQNTLVGFLNDGYCTEGVSYYNYGMNFYSLLRENIWQATSGKLDLFAFPKLKKIALFGPGMEMMNKVYPSIGDCPPLAKPDSRLMKYFSLNLKLGLREYERLDEPRAYSASLIQLMQLFPNSISGVNPQKKEGSSAEIRTYFDKAGVLIVRPRPGSNGRLAATLKGGNNNEKHNHNDLGSFSVVVGDELLMGDPGAAIYTSKTFSPQRYSIKTLTSYGHPVPMPAGQLQQTGAKAQANVVSKDFTDLQDAFVLDLTAAYKAPGLQKLLRSFVYNRNKGGSLKVSDHFVFAAKQMVETALITRGDWKQQSDSTLLITGKHEKLLIIISVPGSGFTVIPDESTDIKVPYTRLGIRLNNAIQSGDVVMQFKHL